MRFTVLIATLALISACQWVKPTEGGGKVALVKAEHVASCKKLGTTTAKVKASVGFIQRRERTVADELVALAKNSAAEMAGDTIVAQGAAREGEQSFAVYHCSAR